MFTKKQAKWFREQTERGNRPRLSEDVAWLLGMNPNEMRYEISRAKSFDYGNRMDTTAKRLIQMGLIDSQYNLTTLGEEYLKCHTQASPTC